MARPRAQLRRGRTDWYSIRNSSGPGPADVVIYDEIGYFGVTAEDFILELKAIDAPEITLRINSPGGEIFDGIAIHNVLRSHLAYVTTYVDSLAASIASVIALAGDKVVMQPHSQLMIHDGSGLCIGNAADMRDLADLLDRQSDNIAGVYAERAGGTVAQWRDRMRAETWYSADEAVQAGLADEVAPRRDPGGDSTGKDEDEDEEDRGKSAPRNSWDLSIFRYAGREQAPSPLVGTASAVHHTGTTDSAWDGPGAVSAMPGEAATLRYCHAWRDGGADPDAKGSYKFPHHTKDGGPANLAGCRNGLARLSSADIPAGDRAGVEAHLRAHLNDGDDSGAEDRLVAAAPKPKPKPDQEPGEERPPGEKPGEDEPDEEDDPEPGEDDPEPDEPDEDEPDEPEAPATKPAKKKKPPPTDEWAAATAHLTDETSTPDDEFATLTEAL
jgi:ATP-dependent protease ClpP protease subunit